ncbi:rho guanine nucleotide exchange factor 12 isoform X4 [Hyla sarda]|uniref:rho guanine nucleotide exchange factor 12 isoform X4 n=1 Tax=Hyla sarda TaxID=327740 RepID=UPI0024C2FB07|nr:rho guanine nucleotide exchange factor 12 isoform X4 [Hyla sarda]
MSGTQSAASDRFQGRKPTRHGSILSGDISTDRKQKVERSVSSSHDFSSHDFDPTESSSRKTKSTWDESRQETYVRLCPSYIIEEMKIVHGMSLTGPRIGSVKGLVQRCVIIQRDENGFGLTVSGDNPVFVQSVKEDGAAMRAGVQTGDRIIKVNGTLVTHSNHLEVVKLIKSGSYVALTVQGRPPGSPHIPLSESDPLSPLHMSPVNHGHGPLERITSPILMGEENNIMHNQKLDILKKMLQKEKEQLLSSQEEYNSSPSTRLFKEIQDTKKHIQQLQEQLCKTKSPTQINELDTYSSDQERSDYIIGDGSRPSSNVTDSPSSGQREKSFLEESPEKSEYLDTLEDSQSSMGSPFARFAHSIIGAEDEEFDAEPEQVIEQCSCFQSMDLLKSHPAHLAVFIFHVVSQFDPAPLLCYLYGDLYQQTNPKETRRVFLEFYQFFLERTAHLRVAVPEDLALDLERRRPELIPEELLRQYVHTMHDRMCPDVQKLLEDFRQKRNMGLTLAESELAKLDAERSRERNTLEKERLCAEPILQKIEEVLLSLQPPEDEKCGTIQYVILTYMKHIGVKVKEPRILEQRRGRIGFLPKIKQSMKKDKEGEEKWKRRGLSSILGPPRRPSRQDSNAISRALQMQKHSKHLSTSSSSSPEPAESKLRSSGGSVDGHESLFSPFSPPPNSASAYSSPDGIRELEGGMKFSTEGSHSTDSCDGSSRTSGSMFDFPCSPLDLLQEEVKDSDRFSEHGTPKLSRKLDSLGIGDTQSEDELHDLDLEMDPPNWQQLVSRDILQGLKPHEIKQQEVIHELFYTERAHVRTLNVLNQVFHQRVIRESLLTPAETRSVFSNLEEILELHVGLKEQMKAVKKRYENSVIRQIGDDVLSWFCGPEEEKLKQAVATFCSNQPFALEMIKSRQKKDSKFLTFVQDAESNPLCRRLQLKDIIPTEMQRLTKYPLLLDNIAKYSDQSEEKLKLKSAADHCRQILNHVNQAVREAENKQRLEDYQRRLDLSYLKPGEYPMIDELRSLDLTKRKMSHEGPLAWKVNRDKIIDLYTLLLEDILVLLQRQDDKLILRCHSKILATTSDSKHIFSPVIKLNTVLVRQVATDNKALFVISMSDNGAQIYELIANTVSEKNVWQDLITRMAAASKEEDPRPAIPLQVTPGITNEEEHEDGEKRKSEHEDKGGEALTGPNSDKNSDPEGSAMSREGGDSIVQPVQSNLLPPTSTSPSHTPYYTAAEHTWAQDALRNLELLRELLMQQVKLLQKEETENFQRFCSRSAQRMAETDRQSRPVGHNHQRKRIEKTCANKQTSIQQKIERRSSELGDVGSEMAEEAPEDSAEQFFDAHEPQSNEQSKNYSKDSEDIQYRISGRYLILEGYGNMQESSTDEDFVYSESSTQCTYTEQQAGSSNPADRLNPPVIGHLEPTPPSEMFKQMLHYIEKIETDLQQLKGLENCYSALRNKLAASGLLEEEPDITMLPTDKG